MTDLADTLKLITDALAGAAATDKGLERIPGASLGRFYALVPDRHQLKTIDVEALFDVPVAKRGHYTCTTPASLAAYVTRHADTATELWAAPLVGTVVAVIDGHDEETAGWGRHTATLVLEHTQPWKRLSAACNGAMNQSSFALWVDEMAEYITDPNPADLLELVDTLQVTSSGKSTQIRRSGHGTHVAWDEETRLSAGKAGADLPAKITVELPVFEGVDLALKLEVRVIADAKVGEPVTFRLNCSRRLDAVVTAGRHAVALVAEGIPDTIPVFEGTPAANVGMPT